MADAAAPKGGKEEEKGCLGKAGDAIGAFFLFIFEMVFFVVKKIYELIVLIVACFEFMWYPIKERIKGCCRWCENSKNRSNDPHYSTFDNEV
mmetsp:Transcript_21543/g.26496  ORF Transcript_21543/g.26496 Transcript_21543/m.26496 type:complete len:92 (+) Transcript_21543:23-298(+)